MTDSPTNRLAELRQAKGWHRTKVAAVFNVSEKTVYRWEVEDTSIPSDFIPTLADLFETTAEHLMGWDRQPTDRERAAA